jgi:hypothetical protein
MIDFLLKNKFRIIGGLAIVAILITAICVRNIFFTGGKPIDCNKPGVCPDVEFRQ